MFDRRPVLVLALGLAACTPSDDSAGQAAADEGQAAAGTPHAEEAAEGFEWLFDGESLDMWRGYGRPDVPAGWSIEDGTLAFTPGVEDGDIVTRLTYTDFDLRLEWKISEGGNSGIFFGVVEGPERTYESGPEMQVLDNAGHPDGKDPLTSAGSDYGVYAPTSDVTRPVGQWNEARIVRRGNHVEHWLNGTRVVAYELGSDEWKARVAETKFADWPDYGVHHEGTIGLQDHGNAVWYRNIRIRRLDS